MMFPFEVLFPRFLHEAFTVLGTPRTILESSVGYLSPSSPVRVGFRVFVHACLADLLKASSHRRQLN